MPHVTALPLLALAFALGAQPLSAQEVTDGPANDIAADPATPVAAADGATVYTPDFFTRFSPRNALDMVSQLPGFQIRDEQNQQGAQRGLGQATGNVLVNGERLASKSEGIREQLSRIPAQGVVRVELVDGSAFAIPGLSGQVANIVTSTVDNFSGQYRWDFNARSFYTDLSILGGEVSVKGVSGPIEYTAAVSNAPDRGGFGGAYQIFDGDGALLETRTGSLVANGEFPKVAAGIKYDGPGSSVGNLTASYRLSRFDLTELEHRNLAVGTDYDSSVLLSDDGYEYEIAGDYDFAIGPGRLKLIGLERFRTSDFVQTARNLYPDGIAGEGSRYAQIVDTGEHIARAEYSWKLGKADMQFAAEAAFNRLAKDASLFVLDGEDFAEVDFPQGDGAVTEDRYETVLTAGYPLARNMTTQIGVGWEYSKIAQSGTANTTREFWRPKGSATLSWSPQAGLDITAKIERRVGQLQFEDFLARVFLENDNENAVNANLVPEQAWDSDLTIKKSLGAWGSTQVRLFDRRTEDYIDVIPLEGGGEARGNIDRLHRYGLETTNTFNLDPIGVRGAKVDLRVVVQHMELTDPTTGKLRPESRRSPFLLDFDYRHDLPGSAWAYGVSVFHLADSRFFRVYEEARENEGPAFVDLFLENKDVFGMTMTATVGNIFNATHNFERTVYEGVRGSSPIDFVEAGRRRIGPIVDFSVKGSF